MGTRTPVFAVRGRRLNRLTMEAWLPNYKYMEDYITTHGTKEEREANLKEFQEKILISKCHGKAFRYPVIKQWFLDKYPDIRDFGMPEEDQTEKTGAASADNIVSIDAVQDSEEALEKGA